MQIDTEAAESKDLVPVMLEVCREFDSGSDADSHRLVAYVCLRDIYSRFRNSGRFLSRRDALNNLKVCEPMIRPGTTKFVTARSIQNHAILACAV